MSTFCTLTAVCRACEVRSERSCATGINATRSPQHRAAILEGRFQRYTCDSCQHELRVESPFIYVDFDRRQWIAAYPSSSEHAWKALEREPLDAFERNLAGVDAPIVAREIADHWTVRAVFGLVALREKLLCFEQGIDDAVLEAFKVDAMRAPPRRFHPAGRPRLTAADTSGLTLTIPSGAHDAGPGPLSIRPSAAALDVIAGERWSPLRRELSAGPYVDAGRLFIDGAVGA